MLTLFFCRCDRMNADLKKACKAYKEDFFSALQSRYGIPKGELEEIWENCFSKKKSSKTKNAWQAFSNHHRPLLKSRGLRFGEIAQELGRMWHELSPEEKAKYKPVGIRVQDEDDPVNKEATPVDFNTEKEKELWATYREFKISDLRSMCIRLGLETSTNRRQMIMALVLHRLSSDEN